MFTLFALALPLLATNQTARVYNYCPYDVVLQSVQTSLLKTLTIPSKSVYSEPLLPISNSVGASLTTYFTADTGFTNPTQFEYAYDTATNLVYYDVSLIDCVSGQDGTGLSWVAERDKGVWRWVEDRWVQDVYVSAGTVLSG